MGKIYLRKRTRNIWYKYQDAYIDGKRRQQYLGRANWLEVFLWKLSRLLKRG